ncbi:hypothetical protein Syn7502_00865 [Synechococcus sp. PCC 7502]|uniref:anti-sigma factor family protein n=1 Tax=Synechococcus sp. PCC 7502 TaxID=1173263 RepID=UPI00029FD056|nr:hypothetical protein [Synechococcus sp. PCC 7502]AFY72995.1 hypothetical protein Syn7502_00865 [Synechococcus sp. PCC 7502]
MSIHGKNPAQERFELLSAYVDNEVTGAEKIQVEQWLRDDPNYRHQYQQLLKVKKLLIDLPIPATVKTEYVVDQVITKIKKRSQRNLSIGTAFVAIMIATFGSVATSYRWKVAEETTNSPVNKEEQLILAMEEPIIPLPQSLPKNR